MFILDSKSLLAILKAIENTRTKITTSYVHPLATIPRAVPAAGGCSVLVMVIRKIDKPTARAQASTDMNSQLSNRCDKGLAKQA